MRNLSVRLVVAFADILVEVEHHLVDAVDRADAVANVLPAAAADGLLIAAGGLDAPEQRALDRAPLFQHRQQVDALRAVRAPAA